MNPTQYLDRVEPDTKLCRECHTRKPKSAFHKGLVCKQCDNSRPRNNTISKAANHRARTRAYGRLAKMFPVEFKALMAEELAKAKTEARQLGTVAVAHDDEPAHEVVVQLKPGPRMVGETALDRVREDVGRCPICINRHDKGHVCPACGSRPQVSAVAAR